MPAEYAMGYRKPPVSGRFQKGQSGNPGGRPKVRPRPTRQQRFAQMLEAMIVEPVETVATRPCRSSLAAWAKGIVLDGVRGKTAVMRLAFSLFDELDVMEGNLEPRRRARPVRLPQWAEVDDGDEADSPDEQGLGEEAPLPEWGEFAGEAPGSTIQTSPPDLSRPATAGRPDETHSERESEKKTLLDGELQSAGSWVARSAAGHDRDGAGGTHFQTAASALTEGNEQGLKTESERQFLAISCRVPSEKELRRREEQAEMDRQRRAYESLPGKIKAFCDKHGWEYPPGMQTPKDVPAPLSEGQTQGITNPRPEEGPHKRALRARFERLAWAESEEAARKAALAAKAEGVPMLRQAQHEGIEKTPRPEPVEGPEPLPDYAIWMRGQQTAP